MIGAWKKVGRAQWTWNLTEDREGLRLTCVREAITPSLRSSVSRFTDGMSLSPEEEATGPQRWWLRCRSGAACLPCPQVSPCGLSGLDREPRPQ